MFKLKLENTGEILFFDDEPNVCPICNTHIVAQPISAVSNFKDKSYEVVFLCNNKQCTHLFIATYKKKYINSVVVRNNIIKLFPKKINIIEINDDIKNISPLFYKIYQQSNEAESLDLDEIAGVGYRKALEFLIKDFCITNNPEYIDKIKKTPLMQVIKTYMEEAPKIKSCAERAVWLGNDETHYERKWEDKDINDMKILIKLTLHHIESELLTKKFEYEMNK